MIVSYFSEKELTPPDMNRWLQNHDGFEAGWEGRFYLGDAVLNWPALTGFDGGWVPEPSETSTGFGYYIRETGM